MTILKGLIKPGTVNVVGFSSKARGGKDYMTDVVAVPRFKCIPIPLANHFKVDTVAKDGADFHEVFVGDKSDATRILLQQRGTEQGRDVYGENIWCNHVEVWMAYFQSKGFLNFVIPDVRFPNEVAFVQEMGGIVIRLTGRGGLTAGTSAHISETALDGSDVFDFTVDNSPDNGTKAVYQVERIIARYIHP